MRRLVTVLFAASCLTLALAPVARADEASPPVVTVQDPGEAPRELLRYAFVAGQTQEVVLSLNTSVSQTADGETRSGSTPQIDVTMSATISEVGLDNIITVATSIDDVEVDEDATGGDEVADAVEALVGLQMTLTITDRGEVLAADAVIPDDLEETARQLLQQFVDQARSLTVPLPDEEVGLGARWKAVQTPTLSGISIRQTSTYELVERTDEGVELEVTVSQRATRQTITDPNTGQDLEILSSKGKGDGSVTLALDQPLPSESDTHLQVRQRLRVDDTEVSQRITANVFVKPS